jgi:multidrug transporter EmrE-like cation transporter
MNITKVYIAILPGISYQLYAKHYDIKKEKSSMYLSIIFFKVSVLFLLSPPLSISVSFYWAYALMPLYPG